MVTDALGSRMKENYEAIAKTRLTRRMPVIIRVDGKAFHSFTKGFRKPFDDTLITSMQETMKFLCQSIQGCILGYQQSDEISLLLVDYKTLTSEAWFNNEVQKICSISASMATLEFNRQFIENSFMTRVHDEGPLGEAYEKACNKGAMFDSRCFTIPKEEVTNYFYWRQLDATRNSIEMVGRAYFSHKDLDRKNCSMIQDMLHEQHGINWNDFPIYKKRGSCCRKTAESGWQIDTEIPIFRGAGRDYIDSLIEPEQI